jgi:hypothetical protein
MAALDDQAQSTFLKTIRKHATLKKFFFEIYFKFKRANRM